MKLFSLVGRQAWALGNVRGLLTCGCKQHELLIFGDVPSRKTLLELEGGARCKEEASCRSNCCGLVAVACIKTS